MMKQQIKYFKKCLILSGVLIIGQASFAQKTTNDLFLHGARGLEVFFLKNFKPPDDAVFLDSIFIDCQIQISKGGKLSLVSDVEMDTKSNHRLEHRKSIANLNDALGEETARVLRYSSGLWKFNKAQDDPLNLKLALDFKTILKLRGTDPATIDGSSANVWYVVTPIPYYDYGVTAYEEGKHKLALKYFNSHLVGTPNDVDALFNVGALYQKLGETEAACSSWNKSKALGDTEVNWLIEKHCSSKGGVKKDSVHVVVDKMAEMPKYQGYGPGLESMYAFLGENLRVPKDGGSSVDGKVYVAFVVKANGEIGERKVIKKLSPKFDREALKVVNLFPRWIPGERNGEKVASWYTLPIKFKLVGPGDSWGKVQYDKGNKYFSQGDLESAISNYLEAVKLDPKYVDAYFNLATSYHKLGKVAEACAAWRTCSDLGDLEAKKKIAEICGEDQ